MLSDDRLLSLNEMGLIPGPGEEEAPFSARVDYCLHLKEHLPQPLKANFSNSLQGPEAIARASGHLKTLYDCAPTWTPLFFSNDKLPFWHGGCAWIFQMTDDSPTSALVQLRQAFCRSSTYLGIYKKEELLAHELVHVGRMAFQEPRFEELLAFRTASSPFRRWLGPLVQSSTESALFLLFLFIVIVFDVFLLALGRPDAYVLASWLKIIPLAAIIAALARLWKRHQAFNACLKNLKECVGQSKAESVAYRLQDDEIFLFSKMTSDAIGNYALAKKEKELRWRVIHKAYFSIDFLRKVN